MISSQPVEWYVYAFMTAVGLVLCREPVPSGDSSNMRHHHESWDALIFPVIMMASEGK